MYIKSVDKVQAIDFVQEYHYSKVMPRLTKHYLGLFQDDRMLGVLTLGWGTQPLQTIRKLFPDTDYQTKDYFEIGKMCLHPDFNKTQNTGSQFVSLVKNWMKVNTDCSLLYTLADGIVGKVGYVYQSANFLYGGHFWTDVYMGADGEKIHPRSAKELLKENAKFLGKKKVFWLTPDFTETIGVKRYRGKMFRYMMPLNKSARKILLRSGWGIEYPKDHDLQWKIQAGKGVYHDVYEIPDFVLSCVNINSKNVNAHKKENNGN